MRPSSSPRDSIHQKYTPLSTPLDTDKPPRRSDHFELNTDIQYVDKVSMAASKFSIFVPAAPSPRSIWVVRRTRNRSLGSVSRAAFVPDAFFCVAGLSSTQPSIAPRESSKKPDRSLCCGPAHPTPKTRRACSLSFAFPTLLFWGNSALDTV